MSEQDYTHISRRELRSIVMTRLGFDPRGDASDQATQQFNEFIKAASKRAYEQCQWVHARGTLALQLGEERTSIPFPPMCGPGSILDVSIWLDETMSGSVTGWRAVPPNVWCPLTRRYMDNSFDSDPLWEEGGDAVKKVKGIPTHYDIRDRILIRPMTDKAYRFKILFTLAPELRCDDDKTVIDSELIALYAIEDYHRYEEQGTQADRMLGRAEDRLRFLRAQQASDQLIRWRDDINLRLSPDEEGLVIDPRDMPLFDFSAKGQTWAAASIINAPSLGLNA